MGLGPDYKAAQVLRDKILLALSTRELDNAGLAAVIMPKAAQNMDDANYGRLVRATAYLANEGKIERTGHRLSPWKLRAKPAVHDLPDAPPKRGRPPGSKTMNGKPQAVASGDSALRAYLVREIRMKLDELENLG